MGVGDGVDLAGLFSVDTAAFAALILPICDIYSHWSSLHDKNDDTSNVSIVRHISGAVRDIGRAVFVNRASHHGVQCDRLIVLCSVTNSAKVGFDANVMDEFKSDVQFVVVAIYVPAKLERVQSGVMRPELKFNLRVAFTLSRRPPSQFRRSDLSNKTIHTLPNKVCRTPWTPKTASWNMRLRSLSMKRVL